MKRARIHGALVGVESVTPEGLKAVYKNFNFAGDALVTRLQAFREHGVHVLGSFIFGLPTDTPSTFDATADVAQRAGVSFAQFVMLTPFPGTLDFAKWEENAAGGPTVDGVPLTRYWLIPSARRPKVYSPHPLMAPDEIRQRTQAVWDKFYGLAAIWQRSICREVGPIAPRLRPPFEAVPADVCQHRHRDRQRACRAIGAARPLARANREANVHRGADAGSAGAGGECRGHRGAVRDSRDAMTSSTWRARSSAPRLPRGSCSARRRLAGTGTARAFLTSTFNLAKADYDRLDAGHVVTRTLEASDDREVVTLGVVRIKITPEFYVERLEDIVSFKKNEAVLQIGTFGNLPVVADMAAMTLDDYRRPKPPPVPRRRLRLQLSAGAIREVPERGSIGARRTRTQQAEAAAAADPRRVRDQPT